MTWTLRLFAMFSLALVLIGTATVGARCDRASPGVHAAVQDIADLDEGWVDMDDWTDESFDLMADTSDSYGRLCSVPADDHKAQLSDDLDKELITLEEAQASAVPVPSPWSRHEPFMAVPRPPIDGLLRPPRA
jgi:hypothetical protein